MTNPIVKMLQAIMGGLESSEATTGIGTQRQFITTKHLIDRDQTLLDMLNSEGHENVCYCVCDPDLPDLPIVFSSDGFSSFTGYKYTEIEGRNCRFLQGSETSREDVDRIRTAIKEEKPTSVNLVNYKKDGTRFVNEFFLSPLHGEENKLAYFIGVQKPVPKQGKGQMPSNVGWVYTVGTHI